MNPLFLLLGLLGGIGTLSRSSSGSETGSRAVPENDSDPDTTDQPDTNETETATVSSLKIVVYDGDGAVVREISEGESLDFGNEDVSQYRIGAEIEGSGFNSVQFQVGNETFTQHLPPYDMPANALDLSSGSHSITASVHSGFNGRGTELTSETVAFQTTSATVDDTDETPGRENPDNQTDDTDDADDQTGGNTGDTGDTTNDAGDQTGGDDGGMDHGDHGDMGGDDGGDTGGTDDGSTDDAGNDGGTGNVDDETPATVGITLVAYDTDGNIVEEISSGESIDFGNTDVSGYKIGAVIDGEGFNSVQFTVDGQTYNQNIAPYDIRSDALDLTNGDFDITVTVHSGFNGEGELLGSETISFDTIAMISDGSDDGGMGGDDGGMDHGDHGDMGGDDSGQGDTGDDDGGMDHGDHTPNPDGTPIVLVFGQSNAGLLERSNALQEDLAELGSDAMVVGVHDGGVSVAAPGGEWNVVTGDGVDAPGRLYTELLNTIAQVRSDTPDAYIAGAVWMQGEADRTDNYDYYTAAKTLFTQARIDLGEDFPITIVGLSDLQGGNDAGRQYVQDAQMRVAEDLDFVTFVDPDQVIADNGLTEAEVMRDSLHFERDFFDYVADAVLEQPVMQSRLDLQPSHDDGMGGDDGGMDHGDHGDMGGDDSGQGDTGGDDGGMDHGDHDSGSDDHSDHGDHNGHNGSHDNSAQIDPPGAGASNSEIASYLNALANMSESHSHDHGSAMASEHMAAMDLAPRGDATHVAIGSGSWDDPSIWSNGEVPGDNAKVLIPQGVEVDYSSVSGARLFTVRVDGKLDFATDTDSQMIFDTMIVSPTGYLEIGTETDPVDPNVDIDLIVANNGRIDTNWDPQLLSRGIIAHGKTSIYGAEKDSHDKVTEDPMSGDTSVKFDGVPTGWQVGDTIVIAGTNYDGHSGDKTRWTPPEDEVRVITQIDDDGRVHFDSPLVNDHDSPREDLKTSVANYTRNVSVESEDGDASEIFERGHVMFMHNDDVDVYYAEFTHLGRTDKSEESRSVDDFNSIRYDTNVQGRYALHLHRAGVEDLNDPAVLEGNAVFGSPGWGYVHHDSNAFLGNNASYDTFGAGFVAETGNETGEWHDNIAIFAKGNAWNLPKNSVDINQFYDIANGGDGFWFQGRMVASTDNVAASVNHGYVYFHRDSTGTMLQFDADLFDIPEALHHDETVRADDIPIRIFDGNEAFAANEGMHVVKANTSQGHDVWSHLTDFTAWNVETGAHLQYTSHYILEGFDVIGKDASNYSNADVGIMIGRNMSDLVIIDATVDSFAVGMDLHKEFTDNNEYPSQQHSYFVIDADIQNVGRDYTSYDPSRDTIINSNNAPLLEPDLELSRMEYAHSSDYHQRVVLIEGTKSDGLGEIPFPNGMDIFRMREEDVANHVEKDGYYTTSGGERYFLMDVYFTDRLTGDLYYETHPVYLDDNVRLGRGYFENAKDNGVQDITTQNGVTRAGDQVLDTAIEVSFTSSATLSSMPSAEDSMDHQMMMAAEASAPETPDALWMDGYDGTDPLMLAVGDDALFVNTGDMGNIDLMVSGGETVLASDGSYTVGSGRTLAVFEASAKVGFDGEDGNMALLEFEEDANLAFAANDGDMGSIAEFNSSAFEENDVHSGIDLGGAKLSVDLSNLSTDAAQTLTLLSADELVGVFSEALLDGLGSRDARVTIDYESDSVTLELVEGTGAVNVITSGAESDVSEGYEAVWAALTDGHGTHSETDEAPIMHDDDDVTHFAA